MNRKKSQQSFKADRLILEAICNNGNYASPNFLADELGLDIVYIRTRLRFMDTKEGYVNKGVGHPTPYRLTSAGYDLIRPLPELPKAL